MGLVEDWAQLKKELINWKINKNKLFRINYRNSRRMKNYRREGRDIKDTMGICKWVLLGRKTESELKTVFEEVVKRIF